MAPPAICQPPTASAAGLAYGTIPTCIYTSKSPIVQVMSKNPKTIRQHLLAAEAVALMEEKKINGVIVVNEQHQPIGALNMHDLLKAGVV